MNAQNIRLSLLILVLLLGGCGTQLITERAVAETPSPAETSVPPFAAQLAANIPCGVEAIVHSPGRWVTLAIYAEGEPGLVFDSASVNGRILQSNDSALFTLPCTFSGTDLLPGDYVVKVAAVDEEIYTVVGSTVTTLPVSIGSNGQPYVVTRGATDSVLGGEYVTGNSTVSYKVIVDSSTITPQKATLYMRVNIPYDGYTAAIDLAVAGPLVFGQPVTSVSQLVTSQHAQVKLPPLTGGGSRIVAVPLELALLDQMGIYTIQIALTDGRVGTVEVVPIAIAVDRSPSGEPMLTTVIRPPESQLARMDGAIGGGSPAIAAASAGDTVSIPAVQTPTQAVVVAVETPQSVLPRSAGGQRKIIWSHRTISTNCELEAYYWSDVAPTMSELSWAAFIEQVMVHNPELTIDILLHSGQVYVLPELVEP